MQQTHKLKANTLAIALIAALLVAPTLIYAPAAIAGSESVYISSASFDKSGYAIDEAVNINAKIKWEDLTANRTVSVELWNGTEQIEVLESYTVPYNVSGTLTPDGSVTKTYTPTADLTEETGTSTYYLKLFSSGLQVDSKAITLVVAESQVTMSVTWQDQNNDRVVEPNELVTFTAYINWAFVENTEAHSLYVNYGDGEQLLSSVSVTAGSGSQTVTDNHGFSSTGAKSAVFTLKDATGSEVKSVTVSITVETPGEDTSPAPAPVQQTSLVGMVASNWALLAIVAAILIVGYTFMAKPE